VKHAISAPPLASVFWKSAPRILAAAGGLIAASSAQAFRRSTLPLLALSVMKARTIEAAVKIISCIRHLFDLPMAF